MREGLQAVAGNIADITSATSWDRLKAESKTALVDVRTRAEWAFVGIPDLSLLGRQVLTVEWQSFPDSHIDPQFAERLSAALAADDVGFDDEVHFICRSGGRSRMAAQTMASAGYGRCVNVADGFEGPIDDARHRGTIAGWKHAGLPWVQG